MTFTCPRAVSGWGARISFASIFPSHFRWHHFGCAGLCPIAILPVPAARASISSSELPQPSSGDLPFSGAAQMMKAKMPVQLRTAGRFLADQIFVTRIRHMRH
ncbi:MAG: hypothetical protein DI623_12480 [Sphingomonas sanxanigenens]|uniref:Uncharacterized protein n=1 Tax=Sphingomonas sanxanigenens TaxID=397260 RepID=A0A2W5BZM3_9SPHN|nr:MAG: hypothetical protein DI623_12480 [Sphingomonas sanxanigenens]